MKVGFGSCQNASSDYSALKNSLEGCVAFFHQGDFVYTNAVPPKNFSAHSITQHSGDDWTVANFTKFLDNMCAGRSVAWARSNMLYYHMPDDHEYPGDNWDGTITQAEAGTGMTAASQAEVDEAFYNSSQALAGYFVNPANNDPEAVPQACSEADAPDSNYQPKYFRVTHGLTEYFVIDCISHRDPLAKAAGATKTMLGSDQKAWLKAHLKSSTATYKCIASGKKTYSSTTNDNGDIWSSTGAVVGYEDERDELLAYIDTATDWTSPGGVFWVAGDRHVPQIIATYKDANVSPVDAGGASWDHACFCACPMGVGINASPGTLNTEVKIIRPDWGQIVVIGEDSADHYEITYWSNNSGKLLGRYRVLAGENKLSYPAQMVSI